MTRAGTRRGVTELGEAYLYVGTYLGMHSVLRDSKPHTSC